MKRLASAIFISCIFSAVIFVTLYTATEEATEKATKIEQLEHRITEMEKEVYQPLLNRIEQLEENQAHLLRTNNKPVEDM